MKHAEILSQYGIYGSTRKLEQHREISSTDFQWVALETEAPLTHVLLILKCEYIYPPNCTCEHKGPYYLMVFIRLLYPSPCNMQPLLLDTDAKL